MNDPDVLMFPVGPYTVQVNCRTKEIQVKREALVAEGLTTCNCRWDGEKLVQQCTLHEAWKDAIHDWAARAKAAEQKLERIAASPPPPEAEGAVLSADAEAFRAVIKYGLCIEPESEFTMTACTYKGVAIARIAKEMAATDLDGDRRAAMREAIAKVVAAIDASRGRGES